MANIWIDRTWTGEEYKAISYFDVTIWQDNQDKWKMRVEEKDLAITLNAENSEDAKQEAEKYLRDLLNNEMASIQSFLNMLGD